MENDSRQPYPTGGRYKWGAPVTALMPVLLRDAYVEDSVGIPLSKYTFPQPATQPTPELPATSINPATSVYPQSRERKRFKKKLKRAKNVYGRGWYLTRRHCWILGVLWIGSCLLVSSAITLAWLALIERSTQN